MIFSYLFLQVLKIAIFLGIPAQVIIRNLQVKTQNEHNEQKNKNALVKLVTVAIIYSLYSFAQCLDFSNQVCLWYLIILGGTAIYLRVTGMTNIGIQKAMELLDKFKNKTAQQFKPKEN